MLDPESSALLSVLLSCISNITRSSASNWLEVYKAINYIPWNVFLQQNWVLVVQRAFGGGGMLNIQHCLRVADCLAANVESIKGREGKGMECMFLLTNCEGFPTHPDTVSTKMVGMDPCTVCPLALATG